MNTKKNYFVAGLLLFLFCFPAVNYAQETTKASTLKFKQPRLNAFSIYQSKDTDGSDYLQANVFNTVTNLRFLAITSKFDIVEEDLDLPLNTKTRTENFTKTSHSSTESGEKKSSSITFEKSTLVNSYYHNMSLIKQNNIMQHLFKPSYRLKEFGVASFPGLKLHGLNISMKW